MLSKLIKVFACASLIGGWAGAQELCPHILLDSALVVNIESRFVNEKHSRTNLDIEWRHHPNALDTFFVNHPNAAPYKFITAGQYRYIEFESPRIKRQLGMHHLKETIGNSPLKLDDLELLANGSFLCRDSSIQSPKIFSTAFSMMWWSMAADTLPKPSNVTMRGARKESRTFKIGAWKTFSGIELPTLVQMTGSNYHGDIWVRSAYPIQALERDPLRENNTLLPYKHSKLFSKTNVGGKREIPLILKLNHELLRD